MAKVIKDLNSSVRVRHFDIVFYGTVSELLKIIHTYRERIVRYAFILHDKDVYTEDKFEDDGVTLLHKAGDIKNNHFHVIVSFYNACTLKACYKIFTTENDKPRIYSVGDMQTVYEYLTHKNDPDKYQYSKTKICSDDLQFFEKLCKVGEKSESDNKAEKIIEDLLINIPTRVMVSRYGRDFVIHMSQYLDVVSKIKFEEICLDEKKRQDEENARIKELSAREQLEFNFDKKVGE